MEYNETFSITLTVDNSLDTINGGSTAHANVTIVDNDGMHTPFVKNTMALIPLRIGLIYSVPLLELSEDFLSFPLCVAVQNQDGLERSVNLSFDVISLTAHGNDYSHLYVCSIFNADVACFSAEGVDFVIFESPFIVSFSDFNESISEINVERFLSHNMTPDAFFRWFPIMKGFHYCVLVEDLDDSIIEDTEMFNILFMSENENDKFGAEDQFGAENTSIIMTFSISDNDGTSICRVSIVSYVCSVLRVLYILLLLFATLRWLCDVQPQSYKSV